MTRKVTLFAVCGFEVALILFMVAWTALASVLPNASPEEQYRFALSRALDDDLVTSEAAFAEIVEDNNGHERQVDAMFWLGRVQFMRSKYEKAAITFSKFGATYPSDKRLIDTTMWIAESAYHFAPQKRACEIYASLPKLLGNPPMSFLKQLYDLARETGCDFARVPYPLGATKAPRLQITERDFSRALQIATLDVAVVAIRDHCQDEIEKTEMSRECHCSMNYSDYSNEMAYQLQFSRCVKGSAEAFEGERLLGEWATKFLGDGDKQRYSSYDSIVKALTSNMKTRSTQLGVSDIDKIQRHVSNCWAPPVSFTYPDAKQLVVDVEVSLDQGGNVLTVEVIENMRGRGGKKYRIAVEEAVRTIYKCSPLPPPPSGFAEKTSFIFTFDPQAMMN